MTVNLIRHRLNNFRNRCGEHGETALHLIYHAALPVALNAEFLHLLRINFFLEPPEILPYTVEFEILLSPLCREINQGLYEIEPEIRDVLLIELTKLYNYQRVYDIAQLLWQYVQRCSPWTDCIELERAQQLTALYFLHPEKAKRWLASTEHEIRRDQVDEREWFVVMQQHIKSQELLLHNIKDDVQSNKVDASQKSDSNEVFPEESETDIQERLNELEKTVKDALSLKESGTSRKLILFIRRSLGQVRLYNEWSEHEILLEAYLRTYERIKAGEVIENLPRYLNRVSHFLILEKSKHRRRRQNIRQKLSGFTSETMFVPENSYLEGVDSSAVNNLLTSFSSLSEEEKQILVLRVVKGYSWEEIAYLMVEAGAEEKYADNLVSVLRKKGEVALDNLRKGFFSKKGILSVNESRLIE